jgi:hypothetical protein
LASSQAVWYSILRPVRRQSLTHTKDEVAPRSAAGARFERLSTDRARRARGMYEQRYPGVSDVGRGADALVPGARLRSVSQGGENPASMYLPRQLTTLACNVRQSSGLFEGGGRSGT